MKKYLAVAGLLIFMSCSKGTLDFLVVQQEDDKAPAEFVFTNTSEGFDSYMWHIAEGVSSQDSIARHTYYLSGKYDVILTGIKGKKTKELRKEVVVSAPDICLVSLSTPYGEMLVELYDETPLHRDNFIKLAEEGYYNGLLFHRVIEGFMIQGGDPESRGATIEQRLGSGGPGYQVDAEFTPLHAHVKGALAAARTGGPSNPEKRSSGSQFYIVQGKPVGEKELETMEYRLGINYPDEVKSQYLELGGTPFLDQEYTVFGRVIKGLEVIDAIAKVNTDRSDRPLENVDMTIRVIK
jgi:peptidyl-prolyl cis-trans isomerase B (cyclophilin B)